MQQYVIYNKPGDFPTKFVVRVWVIGPGTVQAGPMICAVDTIEEARASLPNNVDQLPVFESDEDLNWSGNSEVESSMDSCGFIVNTTKS